MIAMLPWYRIVHIGHVVAGFVVVVGGIGCLALLALSYVAGAR